MEWLLKHLEEAKLQHERDEEPYLRIGYNLGWMKLDQYYTLKSPTLVMAHPWLWSAPQTHASDPRYHLR
jgi:hypothetical protein